MVGAAGWFAASAVLGGLSKKQEAERTGQAEKDYYNSQIKNAQDNQIVTDLDIITVAEVGRRKEAAVRLKFKHMNASVQTGYAGRNIRLGSGSPLTIMLSNNVIGAKEKETIGQDTETEIFGLKIKKYNLKEAERIARNKAASIDVAGRGQGALFGSLLSSAGSYALAKAG
jgi:hypothetical protein